MHASCPQAVPAIGALVILWSRDQPDLTSLVFRGIGVVSRRARSALDDIGDCEAPYIFKILVRDILSSLKYAEAFQG